MEDPRKEILGVVRALVTRPTLQQQADTIKKYFTKDVKFYHYFIDTDGNDDLIAIYQFAEVVCSYQRVEFTHVAYDPVANSITLHMVVTVRPISRLWGEGKLEFLTLLELEDVDAEENNAAGDGPAKVLDNLIKATKPAKTLKKVKIQRDYFERNPAICLLPVIGDLYMSHHIRFWMGNAQALAFRLLRTLVVLFVPTFILNGLLGTIKESPL